MSFKNAGCSKHRPKSLHFFILKVPERELPKYREHFTNLASNGPISIDFPQKRWFHIFYIQADKAEIPKSFEL